MFKLVTANLYFRKIATNHILLETSLVVEYFSTKIVAMVTVFLRCLILNFIFAMRLQEVHVNVKCSFLVLPHSSTYCIS